MGIKFISRFFANMGNSNKGCSGPPKAEAGSGAPPASGRFADPWWRKFDMPTEGFRDASGFVSRIPLRLESTEMIVFGTVDAGKMWAEFANEEFQPILVGGKAVISIWFNNFSDTDCGGSYLETWYNTFVTRRDQPQLSLPMDSPLSVIINFSYGEKDGKKVSWDFDASHSGKSVISARIALPETDPNHIPVPLDVASGNDLVIGSPVLGGTHRGDNGAHQVFFGQTLAGTQNTAMWNPETDSIVIGDDPHYGIPLSRWDFEPLVKGHIPDFKIAARKPVGWISGAEAAVAVMEHEKMMAAGLKAGAINTPWSKL